MTEIEYIVSLSKDELTEYIANLMSEVYLASTENKNPERGEINMAKYMFKQILLSNHNEDQKNDTH